MQASTLITFACIVAAIGYAISMETPIGQVRGRVLRAPKKPLSNAQVILSGGDKRWFRTKSGDNGEFEFERVPAGEYQLAARAPRYAADVKTVVAEGGNALEVKVRRVYPKLPPPQTSPDPEAVRIRTLDIVRARYRLSPQLYRIIRDNNKSDLPLSLVLAQAGAESSFRPDLIGAAGEIGLFQIQLATASDVAKRLVNEKELLDPALNTRLATTYLRQMKAEFGNTRTALASYNQGPGNTLRRGLFLDAQIYADAILRAAWHRQFQERVRSVLGE